MSLKWSDLSAADRARVGVCVEEAAHAIAAVLAGGVVVECTASADGGKVSSERHDPQRDPEISYWGIYARARCDGRGKPTTDALRAAVRTASPEDRAALGPAPALLRHLEPQIEFAWPQIAELASHLYRYGSASHRQIERVLGVRTDEMPLEIVRHHFAHCQPVPPRRRGAAA
jgi:hypothetical protein